MKQTMNSRDGLSVYGYIRQNFEHKCLIDEIIRTIIEFFKYKGGFLYVCGNGGDGKLGISEYYNKGCTEPTLVQSVKEVVDVAAYHHHTMLVDHNNNVWAFGRGYCGQLGTGHTENVKAPQQINLKHRAISVCVGNDHSLILAECGSVLSCGANYVGQLGHGDTKDQSILKVIEALKTHKITQISSGDSHSGALSEKGVLFMWGNNKLGQCGVGKEKGEYIKTPTMIKLNEKVGVIECGTYHSLLTTMNHLLYAFGYGNSYQLGHGTEKRKYAPTLIESLKHVNIVNVAGGYQHTLCVDDEFNVWSFGRNYAGQCGQPTDIKVQTTPKQIKYFSTNKNKAKAVAAGWNTSCVITENNECFVFGNNGSYQIGLKEKKDYFVPTKLPLSVQKVSMGSEHSTFISDYKKEK